MTTPAAPAPDALEHLRNRPFDELAVGDSASIERTLTQQDIELFAILSGDVNPQHLDADFAATTCTNGVIAHGMWGGALISAVLGTRLPGPGTIYLGQTLRFLAPVPAGSRVRGRFRLLSAEDKGGGRWLLKHELTVEIEGGDKPALIAEWLGMQIVNG